MRGSGPIKGPSATLKGHRSKGRESRVGKQMKTAEREKEQRDV